MESSPRSPGIPAASYWLVAVVGVLFALIPWKIMTMEFRYGLAATGGMLALVLAMILIDRLEDVLVYGLILQIPFAHFGKWLFVQEVMLPAKGINVGLAELLLLLAFLLWFAQIFIARSEPIPRLEWIDLSIAGLFLVQMLSLTMAADKLLGTFDVIYTVKHMLLYFFLSRKVRPKHFPWIIRLLLFAIILETGLAVFERATGIASIGLTKGNVNSPDFGTQYAVPGIEKELRAAGTTNDSHTLGLYYAMLLPLPLVMMCSAGLVRRTRVMHGLVLIAGVIGLIITFSRSGWLGFAMAAFFAAGVIAFKWKQGKIIGIMLLIGVGVLCLYPPTISHIYRRVFEAPSSIMESRYEMNYTALDIWRNHFLLGAGPGNYVEAIDEPGVRSQNARFRSELMSHLPVHNIFLYIAAELGLLGLFTFYGTICMAMGKCWQCFRRPQPPLTAGLALAIFCGIIGYLVDGMTEPMFRESVPYAQLWTFLALAVSLSWWHRQRENG